MRYEWTEAMSTGVESLDEEHRTLLQWINRLAEADAKGQAELEVPEILSFLRTYARRHFAHEEDCFNRHRCPMAEANKEAHRQFTETFTRLWEDSMSKPITADTVAHLQEALGTWLANHIMKVDTALKPCVK